ncbi:efflux RND transporter permease subunit, partial [Acidobacteriota bacterium]
MIRLIIKRPILIAMFLIGLCLLGVVSFFQLPIELFPDTEFPMLIVKVNAPSNADPIYVEHHGVIPIESAIAGLENVERIESLIDRRTATIWVYYTNTSQQKYDYLKLQQRVASAQADLKEGFSATVARSDPEGLSNQYMSIQARGEGSLDQIRNVVDENIVPDLVSIDGMANVQVYGGRQRSIEILLDEDILAEHNMTAYQVSNRISSQVGTRMYLGVAKEGRNRFFVNLESEYDELPSIGDIIINNVGPILLKQVAQITDGGAEQESISRINGQEAVTLSLIRNRDANLISLAAKTRDVIEDLNRKVLSDGITLTIQGDEAEIIEDNIDSILLLALLGSLMAILVLWVFLRRILLVVIVALTIPISILISMNLFYAFNITINTLTLVGIAIAVGMLLDSSVVVLENIHRHFHQNHLAEESVVRGTSEVLRAIIAATLTTICIFVPFVFSTNVLIKTLGWQIGVSIISTLVVSLCVAFLLIPTFSFMVLSKKRSALRVDSPVFSRKQRLMQAYTVILKSCLRFPARTLIICTVAFFLSIVICLATSINVPQEVELTNFNLYAVFPSGTTIETADEQAQEIDERLTDIPEIEERRASIQEDNMVLNFKLKEDFDKPSGRSLDYIKEDIFE